MTHTADENKPRAAPVPAPPDADTASQAPGNAARPDSRLGFWPTLLVVAAPAALGTATGWLTGQTGADSTVVAAVLPAVLTGGGGVLLAFKLKRDSGGWARDYLFTSAAVVVFSAFLVVGVQYALHLKVVARYEQSARDMADLENARVLWRHHLIEDLDFRTRMIEQCSKNEALVNAGRSALGLPHSLDRSVL